MVERKPFWEGPYSNGPEGGITQTLLSKWLCCRHRFWLQTVCGAIDPRDFDIPLYYGDAFHNALETFALGRHNPITAGQRIKDYFHRIAEADPQAAHKAGYWSRICYDQFLAYCKHWQEQDSGLKSLVEERPFCMAYKLPSGRTIYLRGKMDGIIMSGPSVYLFEHKIKGEVDVSNLVDTLAQNAQAMFYLPAALEFAKLNGLTKIDGLLYNVIQRPLAGRKHSIKQKKGRKCKNKDGTTEIRGAETQEAFQQRLAGLYGKHSDDFFYRWKIAISEDELQRFQRESLDPILEQLCDWWDSIQGNPFDPWNSYRKYSSAEATALEFGGASTESGYRTVTREFKVPNKFHYRTPFGVFNKLAKGLTGDYQTYLTKGDKSSLKAIKTLFPELATK